MDEPNKNIKIKDRLTSIILGFFIIYGFISTAIQAMYMGLNSDAVTFGIASMEIWKHGNYFLSGFYLASGDPFIFSDILPFYLIPQVFSGYDPTVLKLTCVVIFIASVLVFAYAIYRITGNSFGGLVFAALAMNMPSYPFFFYLSPAWHTTSLLITGVALLLLFNQHSLGTDPRHLAILLFSVLIANLMIFSDSILIAVLVVPLLACYIMFYKNKSLLSHIMVVSSLASFLITYYIKTNLIPTLVNTPIHINVSAQHIMASTILYSNGILALLESPLYDLANGLASLNMLDILLIACSIILLSFTLWRLIYRRDPRLMPFYTFLLIACLVIFVAYVITDLSQDIYTTRYLVFTGFAVLLAVSTILDKDNKLFVGILLIILLLNVYINTAHLLNMDYKPNENERKLIDFLKSNNLTYGYGNYWESNMVTYLSHEDVCIRPIISGEKGLYPMLWISNKNWYNTDQGRFFVIVRPNNDQDKPIIAKLADQQPPDRTLSDGIYMIYIYDRPRPILISG